MRVSTVNDSCADRRQTYHGNVVMNQLCDMLYRLVTFLLEEINRHFKDMLGDRYFQNVRNHKNMSNTKVTVLSINVTTEIILLDSPCGIFIFSHK